MLFILSVWHFENHCLLRYTILLKITLSQVMKSVIDLIIRHINGAGNIGTLWIEEEKMRDIIYRFENNPIIIFPQSIYFVQSSWGNQEIINSHKAEVIMKK